MPQTTTIQLSKERQKFSAAHFTVFPDGTVERLHGHNYHVSVSITGTGALAHGMLLPFHLVKEEIGRLCEQWDEYVLVPTQSPYISMTKDGTQVHVHVNTPACTKQYSFPADEVKPLPCSNITSENLAILFAQALRDRALDHGWQHQLSQLSVSIGETSNQIVTHTVDVQP